MWQMKQKDTHRKQQIMNTEIDFLLQPLSWPWTLLPSIAKSSKFLRGMHECTAEYTPYMYVDIFEHLLSGSISQLSLFISAASNNLSTIQRFHGFRSVLACRIFTPSSPSCCYRCLWQGSDFYAFHRFHYLIFRFYCSDLCLHLNLSS